MRPLYPTAIATARRCWRRYAARYLFRTPTDAVKDFSKSLGNDVHDLHERWIKLGEAPVPDRTVADNLFIAGLPYLPTPKKGAAELESKITIAGITYAMRRDWVGQLSELPRGDTDQALKIYGDIPAQLDLKTSSQPLRYGLWDRDSWLDDTQAVLEALELSERTGSDVVSSRWLYFKTPSKKDDGTHRLRGKVEAMPSDIILGRDQLGRAHLKIIDPFARGIVELQQAHAARAIPDYRSLPYNLEACNDYGACDYVSSCKGSFSTQALFSAPSAPPTFSAPQAQKKETEMSSLFAQLQNGQTPAPVVGAPPAPAFAPPPVAPSPPVPQVSPTQNISSPQFQVSAPLPAPSAPAQVYGFQPGMSAPAQLADFAASPAPLAPPVASFAAPPFAGFVGVNAPEIRAQTAPPVAPVFTPAPAPVAPAYTAETLPIVPTFVPSVSYEPKEETYRLPADAPKVEASVETYGPDSSGVRLNRALAAAARAFLASIEG